MIKASLIPTLAELRAFEAVARLRSVSGAAQELLCSQPCVTNRLKTLEQRWVVTLFNRSTRTLEWTERTHRIYGQVAKVLSDLETIASEATEYASAPLSVSVSPSFASMWLVNRLSSLEARHPEIDLNLVATNRNVDLTRGDIDIDVAIRLMPHNASPGDGLYSFALAQERLLVVCSPSYLDRWPGGIRFQDLRAAKLICEEGTDHWTRFFREAGSLAYEQAPGLTFNNADLVIKSAIAGRGIAIVRELLAIDAIEQRLLIQCLPETILSELAYHFVCRGNVRASKKNADFLRWLHAEIGQCMLPGASAAPGVPDGA